MSIDHEDELVAWLPVPAPAVPQYVRHGGLLVPADVPLDLAAPAAQADEAPGTDLQPRPVAER